MRVEDYMRMDLGRLLDLAPWEVANETRWIRQGGKLALEVSERIYSWCDIEAQWAAGVLGEKISGDPGRLCFRGYPLVLSLSDDGFAIVPLSAGC